MQCLVQAPEGRISRQTLDAAPAKLRTKQLDTKLGYSEFFFFKSLDVAVRCFYLTESRMSLLSSLA
jgi:hypothetical protein